MGITVIFLGFGFYFTYAKAPSRLNRSLMWIATAVFIGSLYTGIPGMGHAEPEAPLTARVHESVVVVHVEGMT